MTGDVEALVKYRLTRARESVDEALLLAEDSHWNTCANRLYYACFYAVNALLASRGLAASKHTGVRGLPDVARVHSASTFTTASPLHRAGPAPEQRPPLEFHPWRARARKRRLYTDRGFPGG